MAKKEALSAQEIVNAAKKKKFVPIYILMGEEPYYIDYICEAVIENALNEEDKDFNLSVFYGLDSNANDIMEVCKRYPVMSEYQVVVLKEAQMMNGIDDFQFYAKHPSSSTILIICNKNGNLKANELMKIAKSSDSIHVFESKKVGENNLGKLITDYVVGKGSKIDSKAVAMLKDAIGADLARMFGEIDKLLLLLGDNKDITPEVVEKNIGISKDYNNFELEKAIRERNAERALKIVNYFKNNPKKNPTVLTSAVLFSFFSNLMLVHTAKNKSEKGLMECLESKSLYRVQIFSEAARMYSAASCFAIIGYIRDFDRKSKGIDSRQNEYDLLFDLVFKILNCR